MKKLAYLIFALFSLTGVVYADIAPSPIKSTGIATAKKTNIQMVREVVEVDLYKKGGRVRVRFEMKNTGAKETLEIGFPLIQLGFHLRRRVGKNKKKMSRGELTELKIFEKGKKVSTKVKKVKSANRPSRRWRKWHVWTSTFEAGERKVIEVRYEQPYGIPYSSGLLNHRYFEYVLDTGSGWKGPIKEAVMVVELKNLTPHHILKTKPKGARRKGDKYYWRLKNFEPTSQHNLRIDYNCYKDFGEYVKKEKRKIDNASQAWLLAIVCNRELKKYRQAVDIADKGLKLHRSKQKKDSSFVSDEKKLKKMAKVWKSMTKKQRRSSFRGSRMRASVRLYWTEIGLLQQKARAYFHLYEKYKSKNYRQKLNHTMEKLKDRTARVMFYPQGLDEIFAKEDYDKGIRHWIVTDPVLSSYKSTWKQLRSFSWNWKRQINKELKK